MKIGNEQISDEIVGESRFDIWTQILKAANVRSMAEIGVWKGDFAKYILEKCDFVEQYFMIDPWAHLPDWNKPLNVRREVFDEVYAEAMDKTAFASEKIIALRGRTNDVIDEIPDNSLDFAYIDGDHTLRGITIDLIRLIPKIKEDGFIGGDDFVPTPWQHGMQFEPTLVCPFAVYFAEAMDLPITALPFHQFLIKKTGNRSFSFDDVTGHYKDLSLNKLPPTNRMIGYKKQAKNILARFGFLR